ncbi:hypothetical protein ACOMHN_031863 [Nucella lapillus]
MLHTLPHTSAKESDNTTADDDVKIVSMEICVTPPDEVTARRQKPMTTNRSYVSGVLTNQKEASNNMTDGTNGDRDWAEGRSGNDQDPSSSRPLGSQRDSGTTTTTITEGASVGCAQMGLSQCPTMNSDSDRDIGIQTGEKTGGETVGMMEGKTETVSRTETGVQALADQVTLTQRETAVSQKMETSQDTVADSSTHPPPPDPDSNTPSETGTTCSTTHTTAQAPRLYNSGGVSYLGQHRVTSGELWTQPPHPSDPCKQRATLEDIDTKSLAADLTKRASGNCMKDFVFTDGCKDRPDSLTKILKSDGYPTGVTVSGVCKDPSFSFTSSDTSHTSRGVSVNETALKTREVGEVSHWGAIGLQSRWMGGVTDSCQSLADHGESSPNFSVPRSFVGHPLAPYFYAFHQYPAPTPTYPFPYLFHPLMLRPAGSVVPPLSVLHSPASAYPPELPQVLFQ